MGKMVGPQVLVSQFKIRFKIDTMFSGVTAIKEFDFFPEKNEIQGDS